MSRRGERSAIGGGSMVHRLDFDLGLRRLAAAADGGSSRDYPEPNVVVLL